MWKEILFKALSGEKNIPSPFNPEGFINTNFVIVDEENRMGFLLMWCSKTRKGINISRIAIPESIESVSVDEFSLLQIPEIDFVDPSEAEGGL